MSILIDIDRNSGDWPKSSDSLIAAAVHAVLNDQNIQDAECSVVLGADDFVQGLNRDYRGKDSPTNVLSFPQDLPMMGDLVFAIETIQREAEAQNKSFDHHLSHLAVHGALHLLGFDHVEDNDAEEMEALEISILSGMGIKNPYEIS